MWYVLLAYFKFLIRSTNQHGVHSPFVFSLITKCFYDKTNYTAYSKLKQYRISLLNHKDSIHITDLGSGSKITDSNTRKISNIVKQSATSQKRAKLLYRLVRYLKCNSILELGTSLGIGTHALSLGSTDAKITTVEGCPNLSAFAKKKLEVLGLKHIHPINEDFDVAIEKLTSNFYDLIFIDGNHNKAATLRYFETLLPTIHNDSIFIFDDIYWSKAMSEAWEKIKEHPKVTLTIDTFYWGFVFFRKEQTKEHFTIRV